MTVRLPGYTFTDLGPDGGRFDETAHPKLGWHTMETLSISGAESAFRRWPPHLGVVPAGLGRTPAKHQYVSLDRHAYAFAGSEADDEYIIQVEVAGYAKDTRFWTDETLGWLAANVVIPLEEYVGIPRNVVRFGFHDTGHLAYPDSPIRLTLAELREFSGHLGHQHMPGYTASGAEADEHWDPGALPVDRVLRIAATFDSPQEEDDMIQGYDKSPTDVARATIRELCDGHWGKGKMTVNDQNWLLGIWAKDGREEMMTKLTDHAKNA